METKSAETVNEDRSVNNFLDLMQAYPPAFISGGNGISLEKGAIDPVFLRRQAIQKPLSRSTKERVLAFQKM